MKKTLSTSLAASALLLLPAGLLAQTTGTSHPEELNDTITTSPAPAAHYVKPSPAVPMQPAPDTKPTPQPVLKQRAAAAPEVSPEAVPQPAAVSAPVETASAVRPASALTVTDDPTSGVVMDVPSAPNELPAGMLVHAGLTAEISTIDTKRGDAFTARLLQPLARQGEVLVPAGTILTGRVAEIHAGSRLHGGPAIQLVPEFLTLPDGTRHHLQAQVVDLPRVDDAKVNAEGVIRGKDHVKQNAIGAGAMTGTSTIAGAMIGGPVGAAVGAGIGAGVSTVWWLRHEQEQRLPENTEIVFSLDRPFSVAPTH